jgi:prophage regulatory protein
MMGSFQPGPWTIYGTDLRPSSAGRILLADLLEFVMSELSGVPEGSLAETFSRSGEDAEEDRASVRSYARWLGLRFLEGELISFVRPFGGGESLALPASRWEVDDFEPRFAWSALDPSRWADVGAKPTHWIFVTEESVDRWWQQWSAGGREGQDLEPSAIVIERGGADSNDAEAEPLALLRLVEVLAMTGLSRSTLYDRIRNGDFPEPLRLGSRMSRWRRGEIQAWLRQTTIS